MTSLVLRSGWVGGLRGLYLPVPGTHALGHFNLPVLGSHLAPSPKNVCTKNHGVGPLPGRPRSPLFPYFQPCSEASAMHSTAGRFSEHCWAQLGAVMADSTTTAAIATITTTIVHRTCIRLTRRTPTYCRRQAKRSTGPTRPYCTAVPRPVPVPVPVRVRRRA